MHVKNGIKERQFLVPRGYFLYSKLYNYKANLLSTLTNEIILMCIKK